MYEDLEIIEEFKGEGLLGLHKIKFRPILKSIRDLSEKSFEYIHSLREEIEKYVNTVKYFDIIKLEEFVKRCNDHHEKNIPGRMGKPAINKIFKYVKNKCDLLEELPDTDSFTIGGISINKIDGKRLHQIFMHITDKEININGKIIKTTDAKKLLIMRDPINNIYIISALP